MNRLFTKDATGTAPNGRLYAGDINALQDAVAAASDFAQALGIGTLEIGETGLQLIRYGAGEARLTGALRADGIIRALGGLFAGTFTTSARDAIVNPIYGLIILNTSNNRYEWNAGSPSVPLWLPFSGSYREGTLGAIGGANAANANSLYFATDANGGTLYVSTGSAWRKVAAGLTEAPTISAGTITSAMLAAGAGEGYGTVFPTTGLYNGYRFTIFLSGNAYDCIYRTDLDATYPWYVAGGVPIHVNGASFAVPRAGIYSATAKMWHNESSGTTSGGDESSVMQYNGVTVDTCVQNGPSTAASGEGTKGAPHFTLSGHGTLTAAAQTITVTSLADTRMKIWPERLA